MEIRKTTLIYLACCLWVYSNAQKHDNTWMWGDHPQYQDSTQFPYSGNEEATFLDTFKHYPKKRNIAFDAANTSYSDTAGNLELYTNGLWIFDTAGAIIPNGDSIGYGGLWEYCHQFTVGNDAGLALYGAFAFVQIAPTDSTIYLFHINVGLLEAPWNSYLNYTTIVKNPINGRYHVTRKNVAIDSTINTGGHLGVCRHGNGRDWWIIIMEAYSNCYHKYLLTKDSFYFVEKQCLGNVVPGGSGGKTVFSMSGKKMLRHTGFYNSAVFDFDRCNGRLSNPIIIDTFLPRDSTLGGISDFFSSAEIASNDSLVYMVAGYYIFQYHLYDADVNAGKDTVAIQDNFIDSIIGAISAFDFSGYGPDGKIYISPTVACVFINTIEKPDLTGAACDFRRRKYRTYKNMPSSIPLFPNYRLGRKMGATCDTLYNGLPDGLKAAGRQPWMVPLPNPASQAVRFDYNWVEWDRYHHVKIQLTNAMGQNVASFVVPHYSSYYDAELPNLPPGYYMATLSGDDQIVTMCKLVIR